MAQGLSAEYFADRDGAHLQGAPIDKRVDPTINFDFVQNPPKNSDTTYFSGRWTGKLKPRFSETYLFMTYSDDGVKFSLNGRPVIENLTYHAPTWNWNWIYLEAGKTYDVEVIYFQGYGQATLQLWWQSQSQWKEIVPASQLMPVADASSGPSTYFVSPQGSDNSSGLSPDQAWSTIGRVNMQQLNPGDQVLFARGGRFTGSLQPKGSGTAEAPLSLGAYGSGPLPVIDGAGQEEAVRLFNQEYWNVDSLDITGGRQYGIFVSGDAAYSTLHNINLSRLVVHDIYSSPRWDSGLVMVAPIGDHLTFDGVIVDGVTAFNTNLWYGIHVGFNLWYGYPTNPPLTKNVVVRNSTVHHVFGDGITAAQSQHVLIEKNLVYETGLAPAGVSYTPNGIWSWQSDDTTVQYNEGYSTHSYAWDGGVFDIDWGSTNTTIQYNYAHDADGYCVAVMGAHNITTSNSIVRFNICSNNGRNGAQAPGQGDIFIVTFDGGSLDGVQIYNNTSFWNPAVDAPWIRGRNLNVSGNQARFIMNNIVESTAPTMLDIDTVFGMDRDLYWFTGNGQPVWRYGSIVARSMLEFRLFSGRDWNGQYADPQLADSAVASSFRPRAAFQLNGNSPAIGMAYAWDMGGLDFFGNKVPSGGYFNAGASNALPR